MAGAYVKSMHTHIVQLNFLLVFYCFMYFQFPKLSVAEPTGSTWHFKKKRTNGDSDNIDSR